MVGMTNRRIDLRLLYQKAGVKRTHPAIEPASEACVNDSPNEQNATADQRDSQMADIAIGSDALNGSKSCLAAGSSGAGEPPCVDPEAVQPVAAGAAKEKCEWVNLPGYFGRSRRVRLPIR